MARLRSNALRRKVLLAALLLVAVALVLVAPTLMLAMAPAIALFAMVAGRVMPGEELIVRLRSRRSGTRRPRAILVQRPYDVLVPRRAGRLIASALAMRPPPARLLLTSR
jgi:voltage-gated potassium channel Kch